MIRIGTCGFSFKDWKGTVYPASLKNGDILTYYSSTAGFNTVEIDASYYALLSPAVMERWIARTPRDFLFTAKCHRDMTRNEKSPGENIPAHDDGLFKKFLHSFSPLIESGRLAAFLAQFGPVFRKNHRNCAYLLRFRELLGDCPLVIEFRHNSWLLPAEREATFEFLSQNNLLYAAVDLPQVRALPPFVPHALGDMAYFRFHGRNREWFSAGREKRYDYLYTDRELLELIPPIRSSDKKVRQTLVFFNNCHAGAALRNAVRLRELIDPESSFRKPGTVYVQGELDLKM